MAAASDGTPDIPDHFFIRYNKDGEERIILAGTVLSFSTKDVSDSVTDEIRKRFAAEVYEASPTDDPECEGLPFKFALYSFQSARL